MKRSVRPASIRAKTLFFLIIILTSGSIFIFLSNSFLYKKLISNVKDTCYASLESTMNSYHDSAATLDTYYAMYLKSTSAIYDLKTNSTPIDYSLAKTRIRTDLQNMIRLYSFADFFYCLVENKDDFFSTSYSMGYGKMQACTNFIQSPEYRSISSQNLWILCDIDGDKYLLRSWKNGSVEIGVCISLGNLLPTKEMISDTFLASAYFSNDENEILVPKTYAEPDTKVSSDHGTLLTLPLGIANIQLNANINTFNPLMSNVIDTSIINFASILLIFTIIAIFTYYVFYKYLFTPIKSIENATAQIATGQLDTRLNENASTKEVSQICRQFNNVVLMLTTLKISLYEEKLRHQESMLEQLRLQLNPHLLINSLNMIYTMNRQEHMEVAQEFTLCLIKHFRYVLKKDHHLVALSNELTFVENYLQIMRLQYPDSFIYEIENTIDPKRYRAIVLPPLILQNLVENSIKYGLLKNELLHLDLYLSEELVESEYRTTLIVSDDGDGFSTDDLNYFNALAHNATLQENIREGIGLRNLIARLHLLYSDKAEISFSNDFGATVTLSFPSVWASNSEVD